MIDIEAEDEAALRRAERARQALEMVGPILGAMKAEVLGVWRSTGPTDTATREKMFFAHSTMCSVERVLTEAIEAGEYVRFTRESTEMLAKVANG